MTRLALFLKHRPVALAIAKGFYLPGSTEDDVRQEAMIGLWEATGTWDKEKGKFVTFARSVISNHLTDCLRVATRLRANVLTNSLREVKTEDGTLIPATELIADTRSEPHRRCEGLEALRLMGSVQMAPFERQVLLSFLQGGTYAEIHAETHRSARAIDNAFQRAKKKVMAA